MGLLAGGGYAERVVVQSRLALTVPESLPWETAGATPEVDDYRLEQELAHQADRLDVTEECVRLRSHLEHFRSFAGEEEAAGRKLNFLLQEMNREATTIGTELSKRSAPTASSVPNRSNSTSPSFIVCPGSMVRSGSFIGAAPPA